METDYSLATTCIIHYNLVNIKPYSDVFRLEQEYILHTYSDIITSHVLYYRQ